MVAGSEVHLDIYDNRIEVVSPGGMYDGTRIQELDLLEVPSKRRNPLLADVFSRLDLMERKGSGFEKVLSAYQKQVNFTDEFKPTYSSSTTWFKAVLPNLNYQLPVIVENTVENTVEKILSAIANNPKVSQKQLSELLGLSRRGIEWNMKKLRDNGIIKRVGPDRGGFWQIVTLHKKQENIE